MKKIKLFLLLQKVKPKEMIAFRNFLERRYQEAKSPIMVFDYLRKFYPDFTDDKKLDQKAVHKKLFGTESTFDKKMSNLYSDLYLDLQDFLLCKKLEENAFEKGRLWLNILEERGQKSEFFSVAEQLELKLDAEPQKSFDDYLMHLSVKQTVSYKTRIGSIEKDSVRLQQFDQALDTFYLVGKIRGACEMINLNRLHARKFEQDLDPVINQLILRVELEDHPLLHLYLEVYYLIIQQSDKQFFQVAPLYKDSFQKIEVEEMNKILEHLLIYCNARVNQGAPEFWAIALELIKPGYTHQLFARLGALSATRFNSFVTIACRAKDFKWADEFIDRQRPYLVEKDREATIELARATVCMETRQYLQVLELLEHKKYGAIVHSIRAKSYILMAYYALNFEEETLSKHCNSFETYLKRHQNTHAFVDRFVNFLRVIRMLSEKKDDAQKIKKYLNQTKEISSREWLEEMLIIYKPKFG